MLDRLITGISVRANGHGPLTRFNRGVEYLCRHIASRQCRERGLDRTKDQGRRRAG